MLKFTVRAAALAGAFALATGAYAQGTITPPPSATGQPSAGAPNSNNSGVSGTVAGSDNLRGNVGSAPNEAVGSDRSPVSGNAQSNTQNRSESQNGAESRAAGESRGAGGTENRASNSAGSASSNQSSVASNSDKTFDPSSLNLGKTSTPMKGLRNKARVEANERRITQQLNRAAAAMATQNPG